MSWFERVFGRFELRRKWVKKWKSWQINPDDLAKPGKNIDPPDRNPVCWSVTKLRISSSWFPLLSPSSHRVLLFKRNSQFGSIWPWTLKEPNGYVVEYVLSKSLGIFWKNSWWVAQAYGGHILIKFVKETTRLFQRRTHGFFDGFL